MTAAPRVPNMHASGTSRFGFSTAAEFWAADSMPRNAQSVSEMLEPIPAPRLSPCGFQAAAKVSPLNQNQPMNERKPTGRMTPHTVIEPIFPVTRGPPKLATVVSQISPMTPMVVAIGVEESQGMKRRQVPHRGDRDRDVADREREEVEEERPGSIRPSRRRPRRTPPCRRRAG